MPLTRTRVFCLSMSLALAVASGAPRAPGADASDLADLQAQNRELRDKVDNQQKQIDELKRRLDALASTSAPAPARAESPRAPVPEPAPAPPPEHLSVLRAAREVRLSGELGFGFFDSGANGWWPNSEFRIDDAKIFVEAPIWQTVYLYTGMELSTREAADEYYHLGEAYVDVEQLWSAGPSHELNLRAGRFYIPFGEEYQHRGVMDDPLVTHSLADPWGIDEGVQLYGTFGAWGFNLAVQNGGHKTMHDFNRDKAVVARLSFNPTPDLHLSASAMHTGKLDVVNDAYSEIWIANAFFRPLGSATTTRTFAARLAQVDAGWNWKRGHLNASAGWADFEDDSTAADNARSLNFQSVELVGDFTKKFYGAVRWSAIRAPAGYPLAGLGNPGKYFYNPFATLTTKLERVSLGLGYRFAAPLVWKVEYSWENGRFVTGAKRTGEDLFSSLLGVSF